MPLRINRTFKMLHIELFRWVRHKTLEGNKPKHTTHALAYG